MLRSLGYSSFDSASILYSPVFFGDALGVVAGIVIAPSSIYMMSNGNLMDVGVLILLPFVISLLVELAFFLAYYHLQVKPRK